MAYGDFGPARCVRLPHIWPVRLLTFWLVRDHGFYGILNSRGCAVVVGIGLAGSLHVLDELHGV